MEFNEKKNMGHLGVLHVHFLCQASITLLVEVSTYIDNTLYVFTG